MNKAAILTISLILTLTLTACRQGEAKNKFKTFGTAPFSVEAWRQADQITRATMLHSFFETHDVSTMTATQLKTLLGESTGYYDYDTYPAYFIGPPTVTSQYGKGYLLYFVTDHSSGNIKSYGIIPEPE